MMKIKRYEWFFYCLLLLGLTGCRQEYSHIPLTPTEEIAMQVDQADRPSAVPAAYHLLPASDRDVVFDTLLGQKQDAYFLQERGGETFVVFDEDDLPVRMAQARRLGSEKGSILILLGMSASPQNSSVEKVYTFEKGVAALVRPYQAGKDSFLRQFQDRQAFDKSGKIHGITGATPIWKPVADQVRDIRETLLKHKSDGEWIETMKSGGTVWLRNGIAIADVSNGDSNLEEPVLEAFSEILIESSPNTMLDKHWKMVAVAEVSLLACGLLIVTTAQIKKVMYK